MTKTATPAKIILTHPRTGNQFAIDKSIYDPFKKAILESLKGSKGMSFTDLAGAVVKKIKNQVPGFSKSISWYTISIRLDLESRGFVETFVEKGQRLNRLKKP